MPSQRALSNQRGFTLLEIIIVLIIIGVLTGLAAPRFFNTIEYSRSVEAIQSIRVIAEAIERCATWSGGIYIDCTGGDFNVLDIPNPEESPGSHFSYIFAPSDRYVITAIRNTQDGGTAGDLIIYNYISTGFQRWGTGAFEGLSN